MSAGAHLATSSRVVIVAPHPDDETLGCGGLISECVARGIEVTVVACSDGEASHRATRRWPSSRLAAVRRAEQRRALARLGSTSPVVRLGLRDGGLADAAATATVPLVEAVAGADAVFVTSPCDDHADHRAAARWVMSFAVCPVHFYEVWPRSDGKRPPGDGWRLDIAGHVSSKWSALLEHRTQLGLGVHDDLGGFSMPAALLARSLAQVETFWHWRC